MGPCRERWREESECKEVNPQLEEQRGETAKRRRRRRVKRVAGLRAVGTLGQEGAWQGLLGVIALTKPSRKEEIRMPGLGGHMNET